ncbi:ComF family protein [Neolewinella antarctica]|uniref:ComF family protein n=1 Tax=Neolewinella antarctica TaxID=442734 RepID=A0ABX0XEC0_9BACT|nr:phosphoribosyltransferase family protein [Neolewinella antarctica]NJC27261.1 ComF family protein [Neolewinella antarctica]
MIKRLLIDAYQGAASLLYPTLCLNCQTTIRPAAEPPLCLHCFSNLSFTNYWNLPENDLTDRFAGRVPLVTAVALLDYGHGSVCQELIHALKYHNRPNVGEQLGKMLGEHLSNHAFLSDLDAIVPVPIHRKRLRKRGYNQALHIARGLAAKMDLPVREHGLIRTDFKGSQTTLGSLDRLKNVADLFAVGKHDFTGQHVLLVDDVVTTGATLDYCAQPLLEKFPGLRISIATLAAAQL